MFEFRRTSATVFAIVIGTIANAARADIVGPVPSAGPPLAVRKNPVTPQHLDLTWGDSCGPDQNDFAVYEGTIGNWYSHTKKLCTTSGALGASDLTPAATSSYYLVVALSATSEGSYGKNSAGAEIPAGLSTCRATQSTEACAWTRVFVSSISYSANLGNLAGADANCQALADAAQLGGTWRAFLSSSAASAATRLSHSILSYRRIDGALVATSGASFFSTTHVNPIDRDEHGAQLFNVEVWTGSGGSGVGSGGCADWTSSDSGGSFPAVGLSGRTDGGWADIYLQFCDRVAYLYCVEQ
jgi:hypothetical protein